MEERHGVAGQMFNGRVQLKRVPSRRRDISRSVTSCHRALNALRIEPCEGSIDVSHTGGCLNLAPQSLKRPNPGQISQVSST